MPSKLPDLQQPWQLLQSDPHLDDHLAAVRDRQSEAQQQPTSRFRPILIATGCGVKGAVLFASRQGILPVTVRKEMVLAGRGQSGAYRRVQ